MGALSALSTRDMRMLVATVFYEAGREPRLGQIAVAQVILNRAADGRKGWTRGPGAGPIERTVRAPMQFSCWNSGAGEKLRALFLGGDPDRGWVSEHVARDSRDAVRALLSGEVAAPEGAVRASHYLHPALSGEHALSTWARGWAEHGTRIGAHVFLAPGDLAPAEAPIEPWRPALVPGLPVDERPSWLIKLQRWRAELGALLGIGAGGTLTLGEVWQWGERAGAESLRHLAALREALAPHWWIVAALGAALLALILISSIIERIRHGADASPDVPPHRPASDPLHRHAPDGGADRRRTPDPLHGSRDRGGAGPDWHALARARLGQ